MFVRPIYSSWGFLFEDLWIVLEGIIFDEERPNLITGGQRCRTTTQLPTLVDAGLEQLFLSTQKSCLNTFFAEVSLQNECVL